MKFKFGIFVLLFTVAISMSFPLSAKTSSGGKIYVQQEKIFIDKECIEIEIPQGVFSTDTLCHDRNGYYVLAERLVKSKSKWICDICGWDCESRRAFQAHMEEYH